MPNTIKRGFEINWRWFLNNTYFPFSPKVDPDRDACLDCETGLLVNHAYGLEDMKVCEKKSTWEPYKQSSMKHAIYSAVDVIHISSAGRRRVRNGMISHNGDSPGILWISPCTSAQSMVSRRVEGRLVRHLGPLGRLSRGEVTRVEIPCLSFR